VTRAWLAAAAVCLAGCGSAGYVARVAWAEARLLLRREPITQVLQRPDLDAATRERLALVLAVRHFGEDVLGLHVGDSYSTYAEVDPGATVWVLSAARRDRLEAYTWWYPVVGRAPYRGFFDRAAAEAAGRVLETRGLDVDVRDAVAFSTLGWFADPLLSTTAREPPVALAETVLHELWHATLYVPGASSFNESSASFVGHRGAIAFFCDGSWADAQRCAAARRRWTQLRRRGVVLGRLADGLERLYVAPPPEGARERARAWLARRAGAALAARGVGAADELLPPNNARLLGELVYVTELGDLDALAPADADLRPALAALAARVRQDGDPWAAVHALLKLQNAPRTLD
jgi:predicted aminopeptidase